MRGRAAGRHKAAACVRTQGVHTAKRSVRRLGAASRLDTPCAVSSMLSMRSRALCHLACGGQARNRTSSAGAGVNAGLLARASARRCAPGAQPFATPSVAVARAEARCTWKHVWRARTCAVAATRLVRRRTVPRVSSAVRANVPWVCAPACIWRHCVSVDSSEGGGGGGWAAMRGRGACD